MPYRCTLFAVAALSLLGTPLAFPINHTPTGGPALREAPPQAPNSRRVIRTASFASVTGELFLQNSIGRVQIVAWDEPRVLLTIEKTANRAYSGAQAGAANKEMEAVRVWTARTAEGGLRVQTETEGTPAVELAYSLRTPRGLPVRIQHESGTIEIAGVMGSVNATLQAGTLRVRLVDDEPVKVDARVRAGDVRSSLRPGGASPRLLADSAPARILYLRVGVGRIELERDVPGDRFPLPVEVLD